MNHTILLDSLSLFNIFNDGCHFFEKPLLGKGFLKGNSLSRGIERYYRFYMNGRCYEPLERAHTPPFYHILERMYAHKDLYSFFQIFRQSRQSLQSTSLGGRLCNLYDQQSLRCGIEASINSYNSLLVLVVCFGGKNHLLPCTAQSFRYRKDNDARVMLQQISIYCIYPGPCGSRTAGK